MPDKAPTPAPTEGNETNPVDVAKEATTERVVVSYDEKAKVYSLTSWVEWVELDALTVDNADELAAKVEAYDAMITDAQEQAKKDEEAAKAEEEKKKLEEEQKKKDAEKAKNVTTNSKVVKFHCEKYPDLMVNCWGSFARFVDGYCYTDDKGLIDGIKKSWTYKDGHIKIVK